MIEDLKSVSLSEYVVELRAERDELRARCERLQRDLNDPPADIQELVIKRLGLVSGEALAAAQAKCERLESALDETEVALESMTYWAHHAGNKKVDAALSTIRKLKESHPTVAIARKP